MIRRLRQYLAAQKLDRIVKANRERIFAERSAAAAKGWQTKRARTVFKGEAL